MPVSNVRMQPIAPVSRAGGRVFVTGFFGALNFGDEAVCRAVVDGLRESGWSDLRVVTRNAKVSREFTAINTRLLQGFFPNISAWLRAPWFFWNIYTSRLITIGGGGLIQDVHSWRTIATHLLPACIAILLGRRVITVGLGAGPIRRRWLRRLTGSAFTGMSAIQVRDRHSRDQLIACGVPSERIRVTADVVPSLDLRHHQPAQAKIRKDHPQRIGFVLRAWPGLNTRGLTELWEELTRRGHSLHLLPFEPSRDSAFYEDLLAKCSDTCRAGATIRVPDTLDAAIENLAHLDVVVAMRLHACIFCAYLNIPFLALPYDEKVRMFVRDAGLEHRARELPDASAAWADDLEHLVVPEEGVSLRLTDIRRRARCNFQTAVDVVRQPPPSLQEKLRVLPWLITLPVVGAVDEVLRLARSILRRIGRHFGIGLHEPVPAVLPWDAQPVSETE